MTAEQLVYELGGMCLVVMLLVAVALAALGLLGRVGS